MLSLTQRWRGGRATATCTCTRARQLQDTTSDSRKVTGRESNANRGAERQRPRRKCAQSSVSLFSTNYRLFAQESRRDAWFKPPNQKAVRLFCRWIFFSSLFFFCVIIAKVAAVSHLTTASCWMQEERHILIDCFLDGKKKEAGRLNKRCVSQPLALKRPSQCCSLVWATSWPQHQIKTIRVHVEKLHAKCEVWSNGGVSKPFHTVAPQTASACGQGPPSQSNGQFYKIWKETLTFYYSYLLFSNWFTINRHVFNTVLNIIIILVYKQTTT